MTATKTKKNATAKKDAKPFVWPKYLHTVTFNAPNNQPPRFVILTLARSYASGEGHTRATYFDGDGKPYTFGEVEINGRVSESRAAALKFAKGATTNFLKNCESEITTAKEYVKGREEAVKTAKKYLGLLGKLKTK